MDDIKREAIRDEGYDPDDPAVVAALELGQTMKTGIMLAGLALAACSAPGSDADARFVDVLSQQGIAGDRGTEIRLAHQMCDAVRSIADADIKTSKNPPMSLIMQNGAQMKAAYDQLNQQGLARDQLAQFIADAGNTYCPDVKETFSSLEHTP
jgi:Protein of unknown function (DUF732)